MLITMVHNPSLELSVSLRGRAYQTEREEGGGNKALSAFLSAG
jgi:hypothetical protein